MNEWILPADFNGHPVVYMLVAVLALAMTGISKGGFGGVGVLSTPLMMTVCPPAFALGVWIPVLLFCDILTLRFYPREWLWRPIKMLAPSMFVGLCLGWLLLGRLSPAWIKVLVGAASVVFVVLDWVRIWLKRRIDRNAELPAFRPTLLTAAPFGISAGITTMIANAAGGIAVIYFLPQRMEKRTFVGTQARFFFIFNTLKIPFFITGGQLTMPVFTKALWMLPLAPFCVWLGAYLNHRMSPAMFHRVVYILLAISGAYLVFANLKW